MKKKRTVQRVKRARRCEVCGTAFRPIKQSVQRGAGRFCSRECVGKARTLGLIEIHFPAHQGKWTKDVPHDRTTGSGPVFEARKLSGLTQKNFADATGVSKSLIEKCERLGSWPRRDKTRILMQERCLALGWIKEME